MGWRRRAGDTVDVRCAKDGTPTHLRCAKCGTPICPRCLVQTPVGFVCQNHHADRPVWTADDLALTPRNQPLRPRQPPPSMLPMTFLLVWPLLLVLRVGFAFAAGSHVNVGGLGLVFVALPLLVPAFIFWAMMRRRRRS